MLVVVIILGAICGIIAAFAYPRKRHRGIGGSLNGAATRRGFPNESQEKFTPTFLTDSRDGSPRHLQGEEQG